MSSDVPTCCKAHAQRYAQQLYEASREARHFHLTLERLGERFKKELDAVSHLAARLDEGVDDGTQAVRQARYKHCWRD